MKKCKNCGREMRAMNDFYGQDINSEYCSICKKEDGSLRTYQELKNVMKAHLLTKEGQKLTEQLGIKTVSNEEEAEKLADWIMKTMAENVPEIKNKQDEA